MTVAAPTFAYTYESPVGEGCHERLTLNALRQLRVEQPNLGRVETLEGDRKIIRELPFHIPADAGDIGAAALLIGVRDNDVKSFSGIDSYALPHVHAKADNQKEHCLRRLEHDEPEGSAQALKECRSYIANKLTIAAVEGVDESGLPDTGRRSNLELYLSFSGRTTVRLPTFYLRLGQALHTLQDSFTHAYRTSDHMRIHTLLNWVDDVDDRVEERDGPGHMSAMDLCVDLDSFRSQRFHVASKASYELIQAMFVPVDELAERRAHVKDVLDRYMTFEPGCTYANNWCEAGERRYLSGACHLGQRRAPSQGGWVLSFGLLAAVFLWRRR
jgi:hypothetical protein